MGDSSLESQVELTELTPFFFYLPISQKNG